MALVAAITTAVVAIAGTTFSIVQAKKAQKAENQIRLNNLRKERIKQLRAARIKRAQIVNASAQQGSAGSSSALSATGNTVTDAARNVSFLDTQANLSAQRASALGKASLGQSITGFAQQAGGFFAANSGRIFGAGAGKTLPIPKGGKFKAPNFTGTL